MVKSRILLNRFTPLILALVVLISLFPAVPAFAAEASSSDGELSPEGAVSSSGDAAVTEDYTVSGVWTINSTPAINAAIEQTINFVCDGQSYTRFSVSYSFVPSISRSISFFINATQLVTVYSNGSWFDSSYRTVDFGTSPQPVSEKFYLWLTANATQQSGPETVYFVDIDGSSFQYSSTADSITLDLIITANDYKLSVDGSEEDYLISDTVLNNDRQQFAGLSLNGIVDQVDYGIGRFEIILTPSNSTLFLGTVWKYPLYIDPNGGTWNGSSSVSVFWELPNTDTDEIYDPVRPGYVFSGWTFSGGGEFNDAGDPPYNYEHGTSPGYLTANWVGEDVPTYTHTISIDGSSYSFTADNAAPSVQVQVLSNGISMTSGNTTESWTYSGSHTFVGIKDSSGNTYDVGASFSLSGSSGSDLTSVLTPLTEVPTYNTIVNLYDASGTTLLTIFIARAVGASPSATLTIGEKQLVFDSPALDSPDLWDYSGEGSIVGIALSPDDSSPSYTPGQTMDFSGVSGQGSITNIYLLTDSSSTPEPDPDPDPDPDPYPDPDPDPDSHYSLTINIFNSTGTTLYRTFSLSSLSGSYSPIVILYPVAAGLSVDTGLDPSTGARWTWLDAKEGFIGFSDRPYSSTAIYAAGGTYYVGGDEHDTVVNLYTVYDQGYSDPTDVDFVSWLATAVGGFLDFELWPGLSLNDLLWIILVMGILFAFLKMTV